MSSITGSVMPSHFIGSFSETGSEGESNYYITPLKISPELKRWLNVDQYILLRTSEKKSITRRVGNRLSRKSKLNDQDPDAMVEEMLTCSYVPLKSSLCKLPFGKQSKAIELFSCVLTWESVASKGNEVLKHAHIAAIEEKLNDCKYLGNEILFQLVKQTRASSDQTAVWELFEKIADKAEASQVTLTFLKEYLKDMAMDCNVTIFSRSMAWKVWDRLFYKKEKPTETSAEFDAIRAEFVTQSYPVKDADLAKIMKLDIEARDGHDIFALEQALSDYIKNYIGSKDLNYSMTLSFWVDEVMKVLKKEGPHSETKAREEFVRKIKSLSYADCVYSVGEMLTIQDNQLVGSQKITALIKENSLRMVSRDQGHLLRSITIRDIATFGEENGFLTIGVLSADGIKKYCIRLEEPEDIIARVRRNPNFRAGSESAINTEIVTSATSMSEAREMNSGSDFNHLNSQPFRQPSPFRNARGGSIGTDAQQNATLVGSTSNERSAASENRVDFRRSPPINGSRHGSNRRNISSDEHAPRSVGNVLSPTETPDSESPADSGMTENVDAHLSVVSEIRPEDRTITDPLVHRMLRLKERGSFQNKYIIEPQYVISKPHIVFAQNKFSHKGVVLKFCQDHDDYHRSVRTHEAVDSRFISRLEDHYEATDVYPPCLVFERGIKTLEQWMQEGHDIHDHKSVLFKILNGLYDLHQRGFVHGDLKPSNVMMFEDGWKLIDLDSSLKTNERPPIRHTVAYAAPEVVLRDPENLEYKLQPAADMFSLGIIACEMFCGGIRFYGSDFDEAWIKRTLLREQLNSHMRIAEPRARKFVSELTRINPEQRLKADAAMDRSLFQAAPEDRSEMEARLAREQQQRETVQRRMECIGSIEAASLRTHDEVLTCNLDQKAYIQEYVGSDQERPFYTRDAKLAPRGCDDYLPDDMIWYLNIERNYRIKIDIVHKYSSALRINRIAWVKMKPADGVYKMLLTSDIHAGQSECSVFAALEATTFSEGMMATVSPDRGSLETKFVKTEIVTGLMTEECPGRLVEIRSVLYFKMHSPEARLNFTRFANAVEESWANSSQTTRNGARAIERFGSAVLSNTTPL